MSSESSSLWILPETTAIHFGGGGRPDDWASREFHALMMILVYTLVWTIRLILGLRPPDMG